MYHPVSVIIFRRMNGQIYMSVAGRKPYPVDLSPKPRDEESAGAAFYVERDGNPRISSVEFENFCIDGLHFVDDGSGMSNPENTYPMEKQVFILEVHRIHSGSQVWESYI